MPSTPSILLLQLKRIGDAILTAPAVGALRAALPDAHLTLVLSETSGRLGPAFQNASRVLTYRSGKWNVGIWKQLAGRKWSAVLDFTGTDRSALLSRVTRAPVRIGYAKDGKNWVRRSAHTHVSQASVRDLHTVDFHHALPRELLRLWQKEFPVVQDFGHLSLSADVALPELPSRYAVIHPGTARSEKYWPAARWAEVMSCISKRRHLPIVITGSSEPAEMAHVANISAALPGDAPPPGNLVGKLSLLQLAAVLSRAELVLGVDSAAMHLAAAFQRPQIALFGPTNPFHWRPRHSGAKVLLAAAPENDSLQAFTPHAPKAPMADLSTDRVLHAIDSLPP